MLAGIGALSILEYRLRNLLGGRVNLNPARDRAARFWIRFAHL